MENKNKANHLIQEKSPYLLQHAYNPVNWYPWCDEAFEIAHKEDKPIFLSIGYSTCHWCHVMERESFEDEEVAAFLNEHFVSVKVDREERPDVDHIYMAVCQLFTGGGGWPTTIFMTADQKPFFAGTYFPKTSRFGMTGFLEILQKLSRIWKEERHKITEVSDSMVSILQRSTTPAEDSPATEDLVEAAFRIYGTNFDPEYGGNRGAPKFPSPHTIWFLLQYAFAMKNGKALEMAERTLECMYRGGIYDHIGFGFCRYSTDERWLVPHFEKMLYDNALLLIAYGEAWQSTGNDLYKEICRQIVTFLEREMKSPEGGFFTAIDADSEGVEGKFYLWTQKEILEVLGQAEGETFCRAYGITEAGNFEGKNIPNLIGRDIPHLPDSLAKLEQARGKRIRPHLDDKILTGQNGMIIAALAYTGRVMDFPEWVGTAEECAAFLEKNMHGKDGRLLARYRGGDAGILGYADDYAYLIWGLIECYQATTKAEYLHRAKELSEELLRLFWDEEEGGFFLTGNDAETLLTRPKEYYDGAVPSANAVCIHNLLKLARLTESPEWEEKAGKMLQSPGSKSPMAILHTLSAILHAAFGLDIKVAGGKALPGGAEILAEINRTYLPFATIKYDQEEKEYKSIDGKAVVYVCKNHTCGLPAGSLVDAMK